LFRKGEVRCVGVERAAAAAEGMPFGRVEDIMCGEERDIEAEVEAEGEEGENAWTVEG
jgi:hypothetical protein